MTRIINSNGRGNHSARTIDYHPQKETIINRIIKGDFVRDIARDTDPPISFMAVQRYRDAVIRPQLAAVLLNNNQNSATACVSPGDSQARQDVAQAALQARELTGLTPAPESKFRQRLEKLHTRVDKALDRAEKMPDKAIGNIAPLLNQAHKNVEMLGRATGELELNTGHGLQVQIICPSAPTPDAVRISYSSDDMIESIDAGATDSTQDIALTP